MRPSGSSIPRDQARLGAAASGRSANKVGPLGCAPSMVSRLKLDRNAAMPRKAAGLSVRGEHAMAWHHDRARIFAERLPDRAREQFVAEPFGDLAIRHRLAGRDRTRDRIDAPIERGRVAVVDRDVAQIASLAAQQRDDLFDSALDLVRRRGAHRARDSAATAAHARGPRRPPAIRRRTVPPRSRRSRRRRARSEIHDKRAMQACSEITPLPVLRHPFPDRLPSRDAAASGSAARGHPRRTRPARALRPTTPRRAARVDAASPTRPSPQTAS